MSGYTSYDVVHVDDLGLVCSELSKRKATSVLLADADHPLYDVENPIEKWNTLPFKEKWLVLMTTDDARNAYTFLPSFVSLTIDENPDRWELRLDKNGKTSRYLFSDEMWGDLCSDDTPDDMNDRQGENHHTAIRDGDLSFMEEYFRVERAHFVQFLRMGPGNAWNFLAAVGLPAIEMLCDWDFYYPDEGQGRCMLWPEYDKLLGKFDCHLKSGSIPEEEIPDEFIYPV